MPFKVRLGILVGATFLTVAALYAACYIMPREIDYSYGQGNYCEKKLTLFPGAYRQTGNRSDFKITASHGLTIGDFQLLSDEICMKPTSPLDSGQTKASYSLLGSRLLGSNYSINVGQRPRVVSQTRQPAALSKPIEFILDKSDDTFLYHLAVNQKTSSCENTSKTVSCNISLLNLKQGEKYSFKLVRYFDDIQLPAIASGNLSLLSPVAITKSSVQNNQIVYSKPKSFRFEMNKKLSSAVVVVEKIENDKPVKVNSSTIIDGTAITLSVATDLVRQSSYRVSLNRAEAEDGSTLDGTQIINFQTSGGPKVTGVNVASSGVDANAFVVVSFDQAISQTQDISQLVSFSGGNATIGRRDNQITFQLHSLDRCGAFSLAIGKGLNSLYDLASGDNWSYASRISCRATKVIGYSVKGRPIVAYFYGNGSTTVLFSGGIHGTEHSGQYIMQDWLSHLDSYGYKIPADKQVVVVPSVNSDGLASSSRYNANNVNLDRNFPTANWIADIDTSSGTVINGGGVSALSEPETKALADLTISLRPRLEVSFHSSGRLIGANQSGDSVAIANSYGSSVGYASMIGRAEAVMGYSMTGEYEDWMGEKYGIAAILIELPTDNGRYFRYHQSALWQMVNI
ncbi:MAG: DUF2817 domain-containing protein [Candidatus Saccharibacteria bacterium]